MPRLVVMIWSAHNNIHDQHGARIPHLSTASWGVDQGIAPGREALSRKTTLSRGMMNTFLLVIVGRAGMAETSSDS